MAVGCNIEPPYSSGHEKTPFAVTLTSDAPVAVRDIVFARDALPTDGTASAKLELHDVDPRVRIVLTGQGDIDENTVADGLGAIAPRNRQGDIVANLQTRLLCPEETCDLPQRLILELMNPAPGESVSVAGDIVVGYGYPGASPLPRPAVNVSGHDAGEARPPSTQATTRVSGSLPPLDVNHPLVLLPVHLTVEGGTEVDEVSFASETSVLLGSVPPDAVDVVMYQLRPGRKDGETVANSLYRPLPQRFAPFLGCQLRAGVTCERDVVLRFSWTGTAGNVPLDYELETIVTSFGPPAAAITVTMDPGQTIAVPQEAPVLTSNHGGTLVIDSDSDGHLAEARFQLFASGFPAASDPAVLELPGVVVMTYSAVGRDGPATSDDAIATVRMTGTGKADYFSVIEYLEFPIDGRERTIVVPVLARCQPVECAVDLYLQLYDRSDGAAELPITMTYRFDVRATSFDAKPLPADAVISFGPRPTAVP